MKRFPSSPFAVAPLWKEIFEFLLMLILLYMIVNRLTDWAKFQTFLQQIPFHKSFPDFMIWVLTGLKLCVAVIFLHTTWRLWIYYISISLLMLFSLYILLTLNFHHTFWLSCESFPKVPGWEGHLLWNTGSIFLAGIGAAILNQE